MRRAGIPKDTLAVTLVGFVALLAFGYRAGQDYNWDFLNYHYYAGYELLANRLGVDLIPAMMQTYLNPLPYVLPFLTIRYMPPLGAAAVLIAVQTLNLTALYVLAKATFAEASRPMRIMIALMCVAVGLTGPTFLPEIGSSMVDITTSVLVLFGLAAAVTGVRTGKLRGWVVAGVLVGIAAGLKQTNALFVLGIGAGLLVVPGRWRDRLRSAVAYGAAAGVAALALAAPWMFRVHQVFGNPLYPFYNTIFKSPLGPIANPGDARYFPPTLLHGLRFPLDWMAGRNPAGEILLRDARFLILMVLLALLAITGLVRRRSPEDAPAVPVGPAIMVATYLVVGVAVVQHVVIAGHKPILLALTVLGALPLALGLRRRTASASVVPADRRVLAFWAAFTVATMVIWLKAFAVERYLLPVELIAGVLTLSFLGGLVRQPRARLGAFVALSLFTIAWAQPAYWPRLPWGDRWIRAELPVVTQQPDVLYVMTGQEPYAALVPYFPESARFVRIDGNFPLFPGMQLGRVVEERVRTHAGELRALIPANDEAQAIWKLRSFGLEPGAPIATLDDRQATFKVVRLTRR